MDELKMVDDAINEHDVLGVYSLFSGGHDSLAATWLASHHPAFRGVIHIDTGTGLPETRQFVEETCAARGWPLVVQQPTRSYESIIVQHGFPGAPAHRFMYTLLKERALRQVMRRLKSELGGERMSKIGLVSGVRKQESDRRAEIHDNIHTEGVRLWLPLIVDWTAGDCRDCIRDAGMKRSPVKDTLHMSGECFCGAYKSRSEFTEIEYWYPTQAERIRGWEKLVRAAYDAQQWEVKNGLRDEVSIPEWAREWGTSRNYNNGQLPLVAGDTPLCVGCKADRVAEADNE